MRKVLSLIVCLIFIITFLDLGYSSSVGSTGANFLKIGVSSKAEAMGDTYVALADDAYAIFWNPGGLGNIKYTEITTTYNKYLEGISHGFIAFVYPTRYAGVYGGSIIYLMSGDIEETEVNSTGGYKYDGKSFSTYEYCFAGSYGYRFNRKVSAGCNVKLIQGKLADYSSSIAFGLDIGVVCSPWEMFNLGLSVQNIGTKIRYDKKDFGLPFAVRLGTAFRLLDDRLILVLDINKPNDNEVNAHAGIECTLLEVFSLRAGYQVGSKDDLWNYSVGFGVKLKGLYFDYAFKPAEDFSSTHKISVGYKFGGVMDEDEVIDYNGMRKKEEYIREKEEKRKLKQRKKMKIKKKDIDFYEGGYEEEYKPRKMEKDEDSQEEYYDYKYEEDDFYEYMEKDLK
ncbi:MAG: PorV/PorQ family protein [bacterium]|nr:PorV/PorQ family protein [bacterium]